MREGITAGGGGTRAVREEAHEGRTVQADAQVACGATTDAPPLIRTACVTDIPAILEISRQCYPHGASWTEAQLLSHQAVFAEGQLVAEEPRTGGVLGVAFSLIVPWEAYDVTANWREFTAAGTFTNHDPERGDTLYAAGVMVRPGEQRHGIGSAIYETRRRLADRLGVGAIRAGARLRGYHLFADRLTPEGYVERVVAGEIRDPTLSFQLAQGFGVIAVARDYLRNDPESCGHAAVIEWRVPEGTRREEG